MSKPKKVSDSDDEDEEEPNQTDLYGLGPYDEPDVCIICQGDLQGDDLVRMLSCHHIFHDACVSPWILEKNGTCPLCKRDLVKEIPARVLVDQDEKIGSKLSNDPVEDIGDSDGDTAPTTSTAAAASSSSGPSTGPATGTSAAAVPSLVLEATT